MGIENPVHLLFIAVIALVVLGPRRLPELAKALGHGIREFREAVGQGAAAPPEPPAQGPPQIVPLEASPPPPSFHAPGPPSGTPAAGAVEAPTAEAPEGPAGASGAPGADAGAARG
jgi:sec-independent protein translocase protein TatA